MSSVPSITLNLDDVPELQPSASSRSTEISSLVQKALMENVEKEKCVVAQYKTTIEQKENLKNLVDESESSRLPLEWVIDIADEENGWFYGTAYHYNDTTNMLHVMVPDKLNPSFDGEIPLDHRTVHLVECIDGRSEALFNKIVRDSVTKIRWDVQWFEEGAGNEKLSPDIEDSPEGRWVKSIARYYIQIANQLLVEDDEFGQDARGFVMLTADMNVRLHLCQKGKGLDDFARLITENLVQFTPMALENSRKIAGVGTSRENGEGRLKKQDSSSSGFSNMTPVRKLMEMSRGMRECLSDVLDDRERLLAEQEKIARTFTSFALNGDLDAGLRLMSHAEQVSFLNREGKDNNNPVKITQKMKDKERHRESMDTAADDAWFLAQKIEKQSTKMVKNSMGSPSRESDVDYLRQRNQQMQRDIDKRDKELKKLKDQLH